MLMKEFVMNWKSVIHRSKMSLSAKLNISNENVQLHGLDAILRY